MTLNTFTADPARVFVGVKVFNMAVFAASWMTCEDRPDQSDPPDGTERAYMRE